MSFSVSVVESGLRKANGDKTYSNLKKRKFTQLALFNENNLRTFGLTPLSIYPIHIRSKSKKAFYVRPFHECFSTRG